MLRLITFFIILLLDIVLQSTLFQYLEVFSSLPNTTLILIISYSLLRPDVEGCLFGFFAGLLFDIILSPFLGFFSLFGTIIGFIAGKPFSNMYRESLLPPIVITGVACFLYELSFYFMNIYIFNYVEFFPYLFTVIVPVTLYSIIVSPIIFKFVCSVNNFLENSERYRRRLF